VNLFSIFSHNLSGLDFIDIFFVNETYLEIQFEYQQSFITLGLIQKYNSADV